MWNKTTYPFLVQALCIIPLKSIRMWASFCIFVKSLIFSNRQYAKIQGTYFKLQAIYFEIHALYFLQDALYVFACLKGV